jgi:hypothetical protein
LENLTINMKQPKVGNYGWTPQQMAIVNAQRRARGQEMLLNESMRDQEYSDNYDKYYSEIQKKSPKSAGIAKSKYDLEKEKESQVPISQRIKDSGSGFKSKQAEGQSAFREKFRKKQMLPKTIGDIKSGISSPSVRPIYTGGLV